MGNPLSTEKKDIKKDKDYIFEDWAKDHYTKIRSEEKSQNPNLVVNPTTITIHGNQIDCRIVLSDNHELDASIKFYVGGIVKVDCRNPNHISDFSFENIEAPENIQPLNIEQTANIDLDRVLVSYSIGINSTATFIMLFDPFIITILDDGSAYPIIEFNSSKTLRMGQNLSGDFKFFSKYLYGLPERADHLLLEDTTEQYPYRLYNVDRLGYACEEKNGLYGSIPILLSKINESNIYQSVYWVNTSETFVDIKKMKNSSSTYWLSERGNLEFYFITGKNFNHYFSNLINIIGKPFMPQLYYLGYHQCRYSYETQQDALKVNENFNKFEIPCDSITLDIDHTDQMKYFTWNKSTFPDPKQLIKIISQDKRKVVTINDPHIKVDEEYDVYKKVSESSSYVRNAQGEMYVGNCWPGDSVWIDYLNEEGRSVWASCYDYKNYPNITSDVHPWNDMNEPAAFHSYGSVIPKNCLQKYKKNGIYVDVEHREVHNIYGHCMAKATHQGLIQRDSNKLRPCILTRSFFAGSHKYAATWTGDADSTWTHLRMTIPMILTLSLCGYSMAGGDVGGFVGNPEPELAVRWYQAATFVPYFRGHSMKGTKRREPWHYEKKYLNLIRETVKVRYRMLAFWYTCFAHNHRNGLPVLMPLWTKFNTKENTELLVDDSRYIVGDSFLIVPITKPNVKTLKEPTRDLPGRWYEFFSLEEFYPSFDLRTGLEKIGVFVIGGSIIPLYELHNYHKSSVDVSKSSIELLVCLDENGCANGSIYIDDGESFDFRSGAFIEKSFTYNRNVLEVSTTNEPKFESSNKFSKVILLGYERLNSLKRITLRENMGVEQEILFTITFGRIEMEIIVPIENNWTLNFYNE